MAILGNTKDVPKPVLALLLTKNRTCHHGKYLRLGENKWKKIIVGLQTVLRPFDAPITNSVTNHKILKHRIETLNYVNFEIPRGQ